MEAKKTDYFSICSYMLNDVSPGNKTTANRRPVWMTESDGRPDRAIFRIVCFLEEQTGNNVLGFCWIATWQLNVACCSKTPLGLIFSSFHFSEELFSWLLEMEILDYTMFSETKKLSYLTHRYRDNRKD